MEALAVIVPLVIEVLQAVVKAARGGGTVGEIRRRLADGIKRGDMISDDSLAVAARSADAVEDFIQGG